MEFLLSELNALLEMVGLAGWVRGSASVYPWANVLHVLGVVLLVGGIGVVDLRMLGMWRALPLAALSAALTPVAIVGLVLQAGSGLVLFAADGEALSASDIFHAKLVLLALAVTNALIFRLNWRSVATGEFIQPSKRTKASAAASLMLWLAIATLGRLIAYY